MSKAVVMCGWDDVPHLDEQSKKELLASTPPHLREARSKGVPSLGSGAIYPVSESEIICEPFDIPKYWPRGFGMDVGWNKTAGVWAAHDRESDVVYLYSEYYQGQAEPDVHAGAIKARGKWMHGVIDPASRGRGQKDGSQLLQNYLDLGLQLSVAENGVEAGLFDVWQRLSTGRLKVFRTMLNWLTEYRMYRRDENGKIVKAHDHLMDATRYFVVSGIPLMILEPDYLGKMGYATKRAVPPSDYDPFASSFDVQTGPNSVQSDYSPFS